MGELVDGGADSVGEGPSEVGVTGGVEEGVAEAVGAEVVGAAVGEAEDPPLQRLVESARAAVRSSDEHPPIRQVAATDRNASVQRQAVSVSPVQCCVAMAWRMHLEAHSERPSIGVSVDPGAEDVGAGPFDVLDVGPEVGVAEGVVGSAEGEPPEQRLLESARAA